MKISVQATIFVAEENEDAAEAALKSLGTRFLKGESGHQWEVPLYCARNGDPLPEGTPFGRSEPRNDVVDSIAEAVSVAEDEFRKMGTALAEAGVPYGPEELWLEVGPMSISFQDGEPDKVIVRNERGSHSLCWARQEGLGDSWRTTQQLPVRGRRVEA